MSKSNGAHTSAPTLPAQLAQSALPQVTELVMSSGVTIWVRPATIHDQRLIVDMLEDRYPLPKEADYKIPVPEEDAAIPGQTMTDVEAYHAAINEVSKKRNKEMIKAHTLTCVDFPEGHEAIIARFLPEINRKRAYLPLPENDLVAVILHAVIVSAEDQQLVNQAITRTLPVEMSEVISELRIFRPTTEQGRHHAIPDGREETPGAVVGEG